MDINSILRIKNILIDTARLRGKITYQEISNLTGDSEAMVKTMLMDIASHSWDKYGCILTSVVVKEDRRPGNGFFTFAKMIGAIGESDDPMLFWMNQVNETYERYTSVDVVAPEDLGCITFGDHRVGIKDVRISTENSMGHDVIVIELNCPNPKIYDTTSANMCLIAFTPQGEGVSYITKHFGLSIVPTRSHNAF